MKRAKKTLVQIKNVSFNYGGTRVLDHIDLSIKEGDYLGIIGPNGSGKTTLLKIMLGLLKPQTGKVELFGQPLAAFKDWSLIGYVPQRVVTSALRFPITVAEVVAMGDIHHQQPSAIKKALAAVNMTAHAHKILSQLSGGQQQRVFIARALVSQPKLLILDEPTVGVDSESQVRFYQLLRNLNKKLGLTLILISHEIDVVAHEVSEVACINCKLIGHGPSKTVLKSNFMEKLYGKELRFVVHGH